MTKANKGYSINLTPWYIKREERRSRPTKDDLARNGPGKPAS